MGMGRHHDPDEQTSSSVTEVRRAAVRQPLTMFLQRFWRVALCPPEARLLAGQTAHGRRPNATMGGPMDALKLDEAACDEDERCLFEDGRCRLRRRKQPAGHACVQ